MTTRHIFIYGRVQGVGFRFYMQKKARELGVTGWVRNRSDGSVEAMIQGSPEAVEAMTVWARRGPPSAAVTSLGTSDGTGEYSAFEARLTE
jgi:acylphosphatase